MAASSIIETRIRNVLNSAGALTVEAEVRLAGGTTGHAAAPQGTTVGRFEVPTASLHWVSNRSASLLAPLAGFDAMDQRSVDAHITEHFGSGASGDTAANLACAVSLAVATSAARHRGVALWKHVADLYGTQPSMPSVVMNVVGGGGHVATGSEVTEGLVILPAGDPALAVGAGVRFLDALRSFVVAEFGSLATLSGLEGGFTPPLRSIEELLDLLSTVCEDDQFDQFRIGCDMAANWLAERPHEQQGRVWSADTYAELFRRYPRLSYIEDPFPDHATDTWRDLRSRVSGGRLIVGDDLLATDVKRLGRAIRQGLVNAAIAKIDQIGTLSQLSQFVLACQERGVVCVISHRSQETDTPHLADLAVGLGADLLKAGCCNRERITKYNRLLRIAGEMRAAQLLPTEGMAS